MLRWLILLSITTSCSSSYRVERPDLPSTVRGATELRKLAEDFERTLASGDLDTAEAMLGELREGIRMADYPTIEHYDYPRIAELAANGSEQLQKARRQAAVDALLKQLKETSVRAGRALAALQTKPEASSVDDLAEALEDLGGIDADGQSYGSEPRWKEAAARMRGERERLAAEERAYRWLVESGAALGEALDELPEGAAAADDGLQERLERAEEEIRAFAVCAQVAGERAKKPEARPGLRIAATLGARTIEEWREHCVARGQAADVQATSLRWQIGVQGVAERVAESLRSLEAADDLEETLGRNDAAVAVLGECGTVLGNTEKQPGYGASVRFASHLGSHTAVSLRSACVSVAGKLAAQRPTIEWRIELERLTRESNETVSRLDALAKDAGRSQEEVAEVRKSLRDCESAAGALAAKRGRRWQKASPSAAELATAGLLVKSCGKHGERAARLAKR